MNLKVKSAITLCILACIISGITFITFSVMYNNEKQSEREKYLLDSLFASFEWSAKKDVMAYSQHDNYTMDSLILSLHDNITSIYLFVKAQVPILSDYMTVLENNISKANYDKAYNEFILCSLLNKNYMENYTKYFERIGLYVGMDYEAFDDVYYSDDYHFYNGNGIILNNYTNAINVVGLELNYISGVLEMI